MQLARTKGADAFKLFVHDRRQLVIRRRGLAADGIEPGPNRAGAFTHCRGNIGNFRHISLQRKNLHVRDFSFSYARIAPFPSRGIAGASDWGSFP